MKPTPGHTKTQSAARREQRASERDRERDDTTEPGGEREQRIGATQLAAPSTRRWRRAGRFDASR